MNDQILSFIRTLLKLAGGFLIARGWTDTPGVEALIGGIVAGIGVVWSFFQHKKSDAK